MQLKLVVMMDPIGSIHYDIDTTLTLLLEAQKREWPLFYCEQSDLFWKDHAVRLSVRALRVFENAQHWFELGDRQEARLDAFDVVLMRKDPPVGTEYIYSTYLLEKGEQLSGGKTLVLNPPKALRDWNEKLAILNFPDCIPPTLVTSSRGRLLEFWEEQKEIVLKPLDSMGGQSIFYIHQGLEPNFNVITETLTLKGTRTVMAQKFIPEIKLGDKRIILIDGKPASYALARVPQDGDFRGNIVEGALPKIQPLSKRDRWICAQVGPWLKAQGLWFVGIDIIGDYLTEINITSPGCVRDLEVLRPLQLPALLMDAIAKRGGLREIPLFY